MDLHPVAITGMACRFPGANSIEQFWTNISSRVDSISEVPSDRWNIHTFYSSRGNEPGKSATRWGGFLDEIDGFDAEFFGISPREAASMDPQQRLLLEVVHEALEDAGLPLAELTDKKIGVFVGGFTLEYMMMQLGGSEYAEVGPHAATGTMMTLLANRLSYVFGFKGPSITVDTACSSSLTATHLAVRALRSGECDIAVVAGVNAILSPAYMIAESRAGMLSRTGRSRAFDSRADGYVRGEGVGAVVLQAPGTTVRPGQQHYATIRGSAINQDGHSDGLTVPSGTAQQKLIRTALADAGIEPHNIAFIEAHGTGTPVGDPIEANAIGTVMREGRDAQTPCLLGSVKTNIGHLEAAAGIAGLIKVALELHHGVVAPHLHLHKPNPKIDLDALQLSIPTEMTKLGDNDRFASVNSFGFGGSNAHVVLERPVEAPKSLDETSASSDRAVDILLPLSAKSPDALAARTRDFIDVLESKDYAPAAVAAMSAHSRDHHPFRRVAVGNDRSELLASLHNSLDDASPSATQSDPQLVFVYSGMGPQWAGMGRDLYAKEPLFKQTVDAIAAIGDPLSGDSLVRTFTESIDPDEMLETRISQPSNFALQVGVTELLRSWGITPTLVCGHSAGEPAAAYASGALSLEDATRVSYARSLSQQKLSGQGRMLAVGESFDAATERLRRHSDLNLEIAAINSPSSVALVGTEENLRALAVELDEQDVFNRLVYGKVPYHSRFMEQLHDEILATLENIHPGPTAIPMVSTVTGKLIEGTTLTADYWYRNVRMPVQFESATNALADLGGSLFLEISPHPALSGSIAQTLANQSSDNQPATVCALRRKVPQHSALLAAVGSLYVHGYNPDWAALVGIPTEPISLPHYPWQHRRYWQETKASALRFTTRPHPFAWRASSDAEGTWELDLTASELEWLNDHRIEDTVVFPAAGYVELAMWAGEQAYGSLDGIVFQDVAFENALYLDPAAMPTVRFSFNAGSGEFRITSGRGDDDVRTVHASGRLSLSRPTPPLDTPPEVYGNQMAADAIYSELSELGLVYGPQFRALQTLRRQGNTAVGRAKLSDHLMETFDNYVTHPVLVDIAFQVLALAQAGHMTGDDQTTFMPIAVGEGYRLAELPPEVLVYASTNPSSRADEIVGNIQVTDLDGKPLLVIQNCRARDIRSNSASHRPIENVNLDWQEQVFEKGPGGDSDGRYVVVGTSSFAAQVERALITKGVKTRRVGSLPDSPEQIASLLTGGYSSSTEHASLTLVDLRSLDYAMSMNDADAGVASGLATMRLYQAAAALRNTSDARVWTITQGSQPAAAGVTNPGGATSWGVARVAGQFELPSSHGGLIDIDIASEAASVAIATEVTGAGSEDQVALHNGRRFVPRLTHVEMSDRQLPSLRRDAAYLITGGLGALGLETAQWLVEHGARHLVLVGRSGLPERSTWAHLDDHRVRAVLALENAGARVEVHSCDVGDQNALARLREQRAAECRPPIRGVIHAAGTSIPKLIEEMTEKDFRDITYAKVQGSWALDRTFPRGLDFFVLYSSVASLIVSPGQTNYAAGNAYLDSLAYARRQRGEHGLSINWGPWGEVGMATQLDLVSFFDSRGLYTNSTVQGTTALGQALASDLTQVAPIAPDWNRTITTYPGGEAPAMLERMRDQQTSTSENLRISFQDRVRDVSQAERIELLAQEVKEVVSGVLRYPASDLRDDIPLISLGLDSMLAIELKSQIEHTFNVNISIVSLLKGTALGALAVEIGEQFRTNSCADDDVQALLAETESMDLAEIVGVSHV